MIAARRPLGVLLGLIAGCAIGFLAMQAYAAWQDEGSAVGLITATGVANADGDDIPDPIDNCPGVTNYYQSNSDSDAHGNACDNCPTIANQDQVNGDGDPYGDACELAQCATVPNYWTTPVGDDDCDGFASSNENQIGTDSNDRCHSTGVVTNPPGINDEPLPDRWPVDFNDNQIVNTIDIGFYVPRLNSTAPGPPYDVRYDLTFNGIINTVDVGRFVLFLNKMCTP